ncbi:ROK family protein [Beutenbergia cavernae DSM 12333]|uniref:ROK family protein n=1 Tax=Beutenbergia cavernae (strain ATCC BAA-8 / DSM 12333 / CCUG 43141 / JCM 11478 / NBRC 16432 / NCIMB 13614 / HKI 0122) TaxID=471853 RepID=C5C2T6_BEUC1|nr:ROK family protein [Beutenbergia cavernae]ACQ81780.1 ROK family protein [Beutenbergia cavernae DSM 12333]
MSQQGAGLRVVPALAVGIDVGGTSTKAVVVDGDGEVLASSTVPTPGGVPGLLEAVTGRRDWARAVVGRERPDAQLRGTGVVVPGIVDEEAGVGVYSANLGWRDVPFARLLRDRLEEPVAFGHDVRAGALAETRWGAHDEMSNVAFVALGTGIALGLVHGGLIVHGGGRAGEIGQVLVPEPGTGGHAPLERVASASAIARRYTERSGLDVEGSLDVVARAHRDTVATEVLDEAWDALGGVLAGVVALLGDVTIVVGGGLAEAGTLALDGITAAVEAHLDAGAGFDVRVVPARLGPLAGALGAALLGMERADDDAAAPA